jgi:hypothetical protein
MENLSQHLKNKQATLLKAHLITPSFAQLNTLTVDLCIHGIPLRFHLSSEELIGELYDHYPLAWFQQSSLNEPIDIFWIDNSKLGWSNEDWCDESSPECHVVNNGNQQIAVQRDFAAVLESKKCFLICPYHLDDGFFNFLRWLLPVLLVEQGKLVLHSSCVLDEKGMAYFSLGPSGAGKSTIASFRSRKKILGDDMNIIKFENNQCWAQAGALGQALLNPTEYSNWYPVKAFFWLKKSEAVSLGELSKVAQIRLLSSAVANVFWSQLPSENVQKIFLLVGLLLQKTPLYELSFPKKEKIWDEIFAQVSKDQK